MFSISTSTSRIPWISSQPSWNVTGRFLSVIMSSDTEWSCVPSRLPVKNLRLDAAREAARNKILDIKFEPSSTKLDQAKEGQHDPDNHPHGGGNTWAGGVRSDPSSMH